MKKIFENTLVILVGLWLIPLFLIWPILNEHWLVGMAIIVGVTALGWKPVTLSLSGAANAALNVLLLPIVVTWTSYIALALIYGAPEDNEALAGNSIVPLEAETAFYEASCPIAPHRFPNTDAPLKDFFMSSRDGSPKADKVFAEIGDGYKAYGPFNDYWEDRGRYTKFFHELLSEEEFAQTDSIEFASYAEAEFNWYRNSLEMAMIRDRVEAIDKNLRQHKCLVKDEIEWLVRGEYALNDFDINYEYYTEPHYRRESCKKVGSRSCPSSDKEPAFTNQMIWFDREFRE